jgi:hypothetical protein
MIPHRRENIFKVVKDFSGNEIMTHFTHSRETKYSASSLDILKRAGF